MTPGEVAGFMVIAALLVISPGPNGVLIARIVPGSGRGAGFAAVGGFMTGFFLHGTLSILGISLILVQSATAFFVVKSLGAAYLCWIGVKALFEAWREAAPPPRPTPARRKRTLVLAYGEGLLTNALNPKVSMFYLAAFPQFMSTGDNAIGSAYLLVLAHALINLAWFSVIIVLFARLAAATRTGGFQRWLKAATGVIFVGFGIRLALLRP